MKPIISIYCEGTETKAVVFVKEKSGIKVLKTVSITGNFGLDSPKAESISDFTLGEGSDEFSFDETPASKETSGDIASTLASELKEFNLSKSIFLPVITEPVINYHVYDGERIKDKKKLHENIIKEIYDTKNLTIQKDHIDSVTLNGNSTLASFIEEDVPCVSLINQLAASNNKRYYKINSIKSADVSLAFLVSRNTKFFPEDFTLIIYTGKEYSKLIFLEGNKLKHVGSTLDIGTSNLHTYDVYFSKILLEMENGGIPRLDNVILCGEDNSENLILSFYGTFPEANVTELKFDGLDFSSLTPEKAEEISALAIPIAAGLEYFAEEAKEFSGINILPKYIVENQKAFQFGWHSYAILPLIFGATFYFTINILSNYQEINKLDFEIERLIELRKQNQEILDQITPLENRISSFDNTMMLLDKVVEGTEVWSNIIDRTSDFIERRRNFWITKFESTGPNTITVNGYSVNRSVLTEYADFNYTPILRSVIYDPLREMNAYSFNLTFGLTDNSKKEE